MEAIQIFKKLIFRVKIVTFRFVCSQTLNPSVEDNLEVVGSLVNSRSSAQRLNLVLAILPLRRKNEGEVMALSFC